MSRTYDILGVGDADIDIMVKPDASLAYVGALGQHRRGSPALFSAQQRFLERDAVVPVVPKGLRT